MKSTKNSIKLVLIMSLIIPGYVKADAKKAAELRKKAIAMAVVSGVSYWTVLRGVALFSFYTVFGPIGLASGIASTVYAHKLRKASKKELQS